MYVSSLITERDAPVSISMEMLASLSWTLTCRDLGAGEIDVAWCIVYSDGGGCSSVVNR